MNISNPIAWALVFRVIGIVFWIGGLLQVTQILAAHSREKSPEVRAKLSLVVILIVLHGIVTVRAAVFQAGRVELPRWEPKVMHGVISFVFLAILFLVLIKPFA